MYGHIVLSSLERFRRRYWCSKTMKSRPCWCPKAVLLELTSFLLQTLSVVPVNYQHRCWSREWKRSILEFFCFCSSIFWGGGWGSGGEGYSLVWPIRGCAAGQGMAFYLSGLNRVYDFVQVCPNWGSRVINLKVLSLIGSRFQTLSGSPIPKMKYWSFIGRSENEQQIREDFVNVGFLFPNLFIP